MKYTYGIIPNMQVNMPLNSLKRDFKNPDCKVHSKLHDIFKSINPNTVKTQAMP